MRKHRTLRGPYFVKSSLLPAKLVAFEHLPNHGRYHYVHYLGGETERDRDRDGDRERQRERERETERDRDRSLVWL